MKKLFFLLMFFPLVSFAHPGVGIVKDSKGIIYYTDLTQVWKIEKGQRSVVIPNVHTHELHIDEKDNLYGEGGDYDERTKKFFHYLWVYRPGKGIDTVIGMKENFIEQDFSLSRDRFGNEYYTKQFLKQPDTTHIFKKSPGGKETVFATGQFKGVSWLHVQKDGSILYVLKNSIYRVDTAGKISLVKSGIGNEKPSFKFSGNNITVWGIWQDSQNNIYAAVFSDQAVKKIDLAGKVSVVYKSTGNWTSLHGVFDNDGRLVVLESSDKNDVRVSVADMRIK